MSESPGSRREPAGGGFVSRALAIRREDSTNLRMVGRRWRGVEAVAVAVALGAARLARAALARTALARTASASNGREALRRAFATTSSVSSLKLASERARGPLSVCTDSRISKRPLGRATT